MGEQTRNRHRHQHDTENGDDDNPETVRQCQIIMEFDQKIIPRGFKRACNLPGLVHHEHAIVAAGHETRPVIPRWIHVDMGRLRIPFQDVCGRGLHHRRRDLLNRRCARLFPPFQFILENGNRAADTDDEQQGTDHQPHDGVCGKRGIHSFAGRFWPEGFCHWGCLDWLDECGAEHDRQSGRRIQGAAQFTFFHE